MPINDSPSRKIFIHVSQLDNNSNRDNAVRGLGEPCVGVGFYGLAYSQAESLQKTLRHRFDCGSADREPHADWYTTYVPVTDIGKVKEQLEVLQAQGASFAVIQSSPQNHQDLVAWQKQKEYDFVGADQISGQIEQTMLEAQQNWKAPPERKR